MLDWQEFLNQQKLDDGPLPDCALTDLSHIGLIQVSGEDARDFLQGQFTNDINKVDVTHSQLSAYCSPKGRMLASFRVFERDDVLLLMVPAERLAASLQRLRMFVLRSKVQIEDASDRLARIELSGDCAPGLLPIDPPSEDNGVHSLDGYTVIRIPGDRPRFQVLGEPEAMQALWEEAAATARPTSAVAWALLDIRAGIPTVYEATVESFVPQMTNLHAIEGVSFTKGCYTGQEIVARMHYLGKLKRRMYRVRIDSTHQPEPGEALFSPHSGSGQGAGRIVSSAPSPDGGYEALAVIEIAVAETGDVHLGAVDGPRLTFLDLPYTVSAP
ncbi:CAF17-like 4Fe-4S cluster assembly/insertion protein YgfZ [endosymbiont of unidentified scaly snail isolate Monju]|uniref:CAF17-like 4Fe-4S cluster assembly/insertion protein YgfZ n=1 Tax=endosymbiont of unidentified scaly snail isolate Monju TaxID=1248727 RepID=UPI0003891A50|nr:folate-binding protein YgfZ [endosymbiont of unidentified scaly snail isolate Monju]BAN69317.1 glycine cleavage T protein [endosymbiont of unidentified scaly snail isolate Monju]